MSAALDYANPPSFHSVHSSRRVWGIAVAVGVLALVVGVLRYEEMRQTPVYFVFWLIGVPAFLLDALVRFARARGHYELRIARDRAYLRSAEDEAERVVDLDDIRHVAVSAGGAYLRLRDGSRLDLPAELPVSATV